jgi:hypothetical protein
MRIYKFKGFDEKHPRKSHSVEANTRSEARGGLKKFICDWRPTQPRSVWRKVRLPKHMPVEVEDATQN